MIYFTSLSIFNNWLFDIYFNFILIKIRKNSYTKILSCNRFLNYFSKPLGHIIFMHFIFSHLLIKLFNIIRVFPIFPFPPYIFSIFVILFLIICFLPQKSKKIYQKYLCYFYLIEYFFSIFTWLVFRIVFFLCFLSYLNIIIKTKSFIIIIMTKIKYLNKFILILNQNLFKFSLSYFFKNYNF